MKTINRTLAELDASGANDCARATVRDELPLLELWQELRDLLDAVPGHGHEGLSRCYQWDESTREAEKQARGFGRLTDATTLQDVRYRWIAVFPATGTNEGHYIHVDLIWQRGPDEGRVPLFLLKTFGGHAEAVALAGLICRLIGV